MDKNISTEERVRQGFKYVNRFMLMMWRLGLGWCVNYWPSITGRIMVVTHTGRKSGLSRRTPMNYAIIDSQLYCTAGFGSRSDWYRNILANPEVEVWMTDGWWRGVAEKYNDPSNRVTLIRNILLNSGLAAYAAGIDPRKVTDEALEKLTSSYHLIHIRRTEACTGAGGPGDLAWIWPVATMILLPLVIFQRHKKK